MRLSQRLHRLETAAQAFGVGVCSSCDDGAYPLAINRWILPGCGHRDEPESSEVYDEHRKCRRCGCACADVIYLELPETVRKGDLARLRR